MKYVISALLILTLTSGAAFAQDNGVKGEPKLKQSVEKKEKNPHRGRQNRRQGRLYSITFNRVVTNAMKLDLDEAQKEKLKKINEQYLTTIVDKEKELQKSQRTILSSLTSADFNDAEVKKEFDKAQAVRAEIFGQYVQGLNEVKEVVGSDNYEGLFPKRMTRRAKQAQEGEGKKDKEASQKKDEKSE